MSELIVVKHGHDVTEDGYHEWIARERVKADALGRSNPNMYYARWTQWICNNTACRARALVSDSLVEAALDVAAPVLPATPVTEGATE